MFRHCAAVLAGCLCVNCSCSIDKIGKTTAPVFWLDGVAATAPAAATTNRLSGLNGVRVNQRSLARRVYAKDDLQTDQIVRLSIEQTVDDIHYDYDVLMGPWAGRDSWAEAELHNSAPTLFLRRGWGFFWGKMPVAETTWVVAGGIGTIMAVEIVSDDRQRIYFPLGNVAYAKVNVKCVSGTGAIELKTPGKFVEVSSGCTIGPEKDISADPDATAFITRVTETAGTAGFAP
ncbi:MAG: hypothetical protein HOP29_00160 [Phycisphaerales bacterium]|nr:hypothetical protein [Phycisphaerales bacterium]